MCILTIYVYRQERWCTIVLLAVYRIILRMVLIIAAYDDHYIIGRILGLGCIFWKNAHGMAMI